MDAIEAKVVLAEIVGEILPSGGDDGALGEMLHGVALPLEVGLGMVAHLLLFLEAFPHGVHDAAVFDVDGDVAMAFDGLGIVLEIGVHLVVVVDVIGA